MDERTNTLRQPSPLVEVESTTASDTIEYSTSQATGDVDGHCETKEQVFEVMMERLVHYTQRVSKDEKRKYWRERYAKAEHFGKSHDVEDLYKDEEVDKE